MSYTWFKISTHIYITTSPVLVCSCHSNICVFCCCVAETKHFYTALIIYTSPASLIELSIPHGLKLNYIYRITHEFKSDPKNFLCKSITKYCLLNCFIFFYMNIFWCILWEGVAAAFTSNHISIGWYPRVTGLAFSVFCGIIPLS